MGPFVMGSFVMGRFVMGPFVMGPYVGVPFKTDVTECTIVLAMAKNWSVDASKIINSPSYVDLLREKFARLCDNLKSVRILSSSNYSPICWNPTQSQFHVHIQLPEPLSSWEDGVKKS
jgi:hypothetical protein